MSVKDVPFKRAKISWTIEEHIQLFNEYKRLYGKQIINTGDSEKIERIINVLAENRRKKYNTTISTLLIKGYKVWSENENSQDWIKLAYQQRNDVKTFGTRLSKNVKVVHVEQPKEIQPEPVEVEVKVEQKSIPMMVSDTLSSMNVVTGSLVKEMIKLDAKVDKSNNLLNFLIDNISSVKEVFKQRSEPEPVRKPTEIVRISNGEVTHEPFDGFKFLVSPSSQIKSRVPSQVEEPVVYSAPKPVAVAVEPEQTPVAKLSLTEEDIRNIVRSEIEKIFGPISEKAAAISDVVKSIVVPVEPTKSAEPVVIVPEPVLSKEKVVKQPSQIRIFVYGINSNQAATIKEGLPLNMSIESTDVFNDSARQRAKNCDSVLVTKYSKHSIYESFRSTCGIEKVSFVSGGLSMLKRRLNEIATKAILRK